MTYPPTYQNDSVPGANDGTPLSAEVFNDLGTRTKQYVDAETNRAEAEESVLADAITTEVARAEEVESILSERIAAGGSGGGGGGASVAVVWKGSWQTATHYDRGDVVLTPKGDLRYAFIAHTSGATYTTGSMFAGSNFNAGGGAWAPLPTNGQFRGRWLTGNAFTLEDLVIDQTNTFQRCTVAHAAGAVFDQTKFSPVLLTEVFSGDRADKIYPPVGLPDSNVSGVGIWVKTQVIHYPSPKIVIQPRTPSDFTITSGSISQDVDALHPVGTPTLAYPGTYQINSIGGTLDIHDQMFRVCVKIPHGTGPRTPQISHTYLQVSSSGTWTNYMQYDLTAGDPSQLGDNVYAYAGGGPADWKAVGSGANLAAITAMRLVLTGAGGTILSVPDVQWTNQDEPTMVSLPAVMSLGFINFIPANGSAGSLGDGVAKCCLWFDDDYLASWSTILPLLAPYGMRANLACGIANSAPSGGNNMISDRQLKLLAQHYGWQIASHYFSGTEANQPMDGWSTNLDSMMMKSRHLGKSIGTLGTDDHAYHDVLSRTMNTEPVLWKNARSVRKFYAGGLVRVEQLPPVDPMSVLAWGGGASDQADSGAAIKAYVDLAIAQKGLCQFVFHDVSNLANHPEITALIDYLVANRANINVVTFREAVRPWSVVP